MFQYKLPFKKVSVKNIEYIPESPVLKVAPDTHLLKHLRESSDLWG